MWDTSRVLYDEVGPYFAPADFGAELSTHLDTDALFDALGPSFPDQQLRHMLRTGVVFVPGPSLGMVVCPHLLSLARGFDRVDSELARLATAGYVEYVAALDAHIASLDDDPLFSSRSDASHASAPPKAQWNEPSSPAGLGASKTLASLGARSARSTTFSSRRSTTA